MNQLFTVLLFLILHSAIVGQSDLVFMWDQHASSISGARNLTSVHQALYQIENKYIKTKLWDEQDLQSKFLGVGYRLAKTVFLDFQIDFLTLLAQHELFGHGHRLREYGFTDNSYVVHLAPPFGDGNGSASSGRNEANRKLGTHENIAIRSGGMESNAVLANTLKSRWLMSGEMNYRESLLYSFSLHDYSIYILRTKAGVISSPYNDVQSYLREVNSRYTFFDEEYKLTLDHLANRTLVNFANTFQLFSIYTYLKVYLLDGDQSFEIPMVPLGKLEWLPAIRFGLTPFGSELIVENHFKGDNSIFSSTLRLGDGKLDNFWGTGLYYQKQFSNNLRLGTNLDFWNQPYMVLGGQRPYSTHSGAGGRLLAEMNLFFNDVFPIGIYSQLGYKSAGFIEGERLDQGVVLRLGLSVRSKKKSVVLVENRP